MSASYYLPRERDHRGQIVLNIVLFYTLAAGVVAGALAASPRLLETIFNSPELVGYGPLIGATILLWVVSSFLETVALANEEAGMATVFIVASQLTKTALLLAAALAFGSVRSLIVAALVQGAVQTAILLA